MNESRIKYLAESLGFHVFTIGTYVPDARIAVVLSPHPYPDRQESAIIDLMYDLDLERPIGLVITVDV